MKTRLQKLVLCLYFIPAAALAADVVRVGGSPNNEDGDLPRDAYQKINSAFAGNVPTSVSGLSNNYVHIHETGQTTDVPIVINATNVVLNTAGRHVTVTAGSSVLSSTDGAFAGLARGYQLEMKANNQQLMLVRVVDTNNAYAYAIGAGTVTLPTLNNSADTNYLVRPPIARWSDDTIGSENFGGFWDDNGNMWFAAIGDQGNTYYLNYDNGTVAYIGPASAASVGLPATDGAFVFGISHQLTNSTYVGGAAPALQLYVHSLAPNESFGLLANGMLAIGGGLQYSDATHVEGFTNRHGSQLTFWVPLRTSSGINNTNGAITNTFGIPWFTAQTNGVPTLVTGPNGAMCSTTNGQLYIRSNAAWVLH
jgi:hypothetical protein